MQKEPELLIGNDVVWTFVNFAGEDHTNFQTLVSFLKMLGTLVCGLVIWHASFSSIVYFISFYIV